jgi:hypothetical protein
MEIHPHGYLKSSFLHPGAKRGKQERSLILITKQEIMKMENIAKEKMRILERLISKISF